MIFRSCEPERFKDLAASVAAALRMYPGDLKLRTIRASMDTFQRISLYDALYAERLGNENPAAGRELLLKSLGQ